MPPNPAATQAELDREKTALEVAQLRAEQPFVPWTRGLTLAGGALAAVAIVWGFVQGLQTIRYQTASHRDEQVSKLLAALSADSENVRLGAARGLTRYPDDCVEEVLLAVRSEPSDRVIRALEEILLGIDDHGLARVAAANQATVARRAYFLGRLEALRVPADISQAWLRLTPTGERALRAAYPGELDHGRSLQIRETRRLRALDMDLEDANRNTWLSAGEVTQLADSTGRVLCRLIVARRRVPHLSGPLDLSGGNLNGARLAKEDLAGSLMSGCLLRDADLAEARLAGADLAACNLRRATMDRVDCSGADLSRARLRSVAGQAAVLRQATLDAADFASAALPAADFRECRGTGTEFRDATLAAARFEAARLEGADFGGARAAGADFSGARLLRADFGGADLQGARLAQTECYAARFVGANLAQASLAGARLGGADFGGADLTGADLTGADFSGANLANADLRGAILAGAGFRKAKNLDSAQFDPGAKPSDTTGGDRAAPAGSSGS